MVDYPVHVEIRSPARFDRIQVLVRIVLAIALSWVGITAGWISGVLYLLLPLIAAVALTSRAHAYPARTGMQVWRGLEWLLAVSAYMLFLIDRFPLGEEPAPNAGRGLRIELAPTGTPTVGSALLRLLTSIPNAFVLWLLWLVSGVLWLVSAITVLVATRVPGGILAFQRGILRWEARLAAYHASLVDEYPPFALETSEPGDRLTGPPAAGERPASVEPPAPPTPTTPTATQVP